MPWSTYTDLALLNSMLGKISSFGVLPTAPAVYCALSSTTPTPAGGNVTEPVGNGYTRVSVPATSLAVAANASPAWTANTVQASNTFVVDSNGNQQQATTPGTTGATAPSWNLVTGGTTTDGGVTWTNMGQDFADIANSVAITFPEATADWLAGVNIVAACYFDALTGGNFLGYALFVTPQPVLANNTFSFPIGNLTFGQA